jgi:hypothetical protein
MRAMTSRSALADLASLDPQSLHTRLAWLEWLMERAVRVPVINKRIGGDALIGLIPGVGDLLGGLIGSYLVLEAARAGAPTRLIIKMIARVGLDTAIGAIPVAGDLWDFFYSSNTKNLRALRAHLETTGFQRPMVSAAVQPASAR